MTVTTVFIFLHPPGCDASQNPAAHGPALVLHATSETIRRGDNGMFAVAGDFLAHAVQRPGGVPVDVPSFEANFAYFNQEQRRLRETACNSLQAVLDHLGWSVLGDAYGLSATVVGVLDGGQLSLYRHLHQGEAGTLYLAYARVPVSEAPAWRDLLSALAAAQPTLVSARPMLNDDCWYTKWRADIEMERKFTFQGIPDTWRLINNLYEEMLDGRIYGFVPELDREFQVFDYESHIFEVSGDPAEAGYISFIPQADGKVTLKRKWFVENAEIRRETVSGDHEIRADQFAPHARTMTPATLRQMPVFRRKRFDVNFESLRTGNIYGVYFDICRTRPASRAFSQCEVEYCRSRTIGPLRDVVGEFEWVCEYVKDFLGRMDVPFQHDTFSKLDFVRQVHAGLASQAGAATYATEAAR
jgi:hypothetical protein